MCGIAGFWCLNKKNLSNLENNIKNMTNILSSRGPNDKGYWIGPTIILHKDKKKSATILVSSGDVSNFP